jgi:hypothetical protein
MVSVQNIDAAGVDNIAKNILDAANFAWTEHDIQTEVEHILRDFLRPLGIDYTPHHNVTELNGRPDTLYGRVIIEYKISGVLASRSKRKKAIKQAQDRIKRNSLLYNQDLSKYVGIILDGKQITFTKYRRNQWLTDPIFDVNQQSVSRMLEYLSGLARKPLHPDFMVQDFGPESKIAKQSIQALYQSLIQSKNQRVKVIYEEWHKTFKFVGMILLLQKVILKNLSACTASKDLLPHN